MWRIIYWVSPRTPEGGQAGKGDKLPPFTHTSLSLATFKGGIRDGNVEGIIRELAN
ncbi:hypothetical protein [Capnocytophaga sp. oral taxon 324]|uniref:hypothetical protein n=1 Tax=Capnocytophaga sp. oral taxon 324 TaxID=712211 RepID=UPI0002A3B043|nr:hypothetical protein HMPREF9072_01210 [Capnocytophaga sp. oral taxon 324 str. F0483]